MSEIEIIIQKLIKFRDERDWKQFHNSKDLALAISIESSELLELFLWKGNEEISREKLKDELADILSYCFLLAEKHQLSVPEIIQDKINKNNLKYPADKAKGNAKKYNEL
ncbi:RS21-C6-like protein (RS21-C6 protein) [Arcticibacter svalbardensis MN12-7]|uniref:RS21-C6-like protein (RS21-C6 protein) n=1 Tax=Arcticibacter svalbardensis MN12-7 TaxID=1150600 RepID=R9GNS6_9SPHI|nr:nucleotide pyrophosphohydrolase [Arcticibacter svalbardensis]EOR93497.1 RS21-C6-like protein (RS21-C6 protein) [Arcticibacter svalbardensis MN12-7]